MKLTHTLFFSVIVHCLMVLFSNSVLAKEQYGSASYYRDTRTASGERYNSRAFTAAHRTLKFGTKVRVINLKNKKSVTVRINDRGPFIKGRIIDLSLAAAKEIGMIKSGVVKVKIEIL